MVSQSLQSSKPSMVKFGMYSRIPVHYNYIDFMAA